VTDTKGGSVATGIYETTGVDEGMVETAGVIEVVDVEVKDSVGPSYNTTGDKMGEVTM
ncbi:hypothetical protein KI387_015373, partial [Taxus chinensis]